MTDQDKARIVQELKQEGPTAFVSNEAFKEQQRKKRSSNAQRQRAYRGRNG